MSFCISPMVNQAASPDPTSPLRVSPGRITLFFGRCGKTAHRGVRVLTGRSPERGLTDPARGAAIRLLAQDGRDCVTPTADEMLELLPRDLGLDSTAQTRSESNTCAGPLLPAAPVRIAGGRRPPVDQRARPRRLEAGGCERRRRPSSGSATSRAAGRQLAPRGRPRLAAVTKSDHCGDDPVS